MRSLIILLLTCLAFCGVAQAQSLDPEALRTLLTAADSAHSEGIVVSFRGKIVANKHRGKTEALVATHSLQKSIVSLAIGRLLEQHFLDSLNQPVWSFFPEWKQGLKKQITIRHLLTHTSGIEEVQGDSDLWAMPDIYRYALAASIVDTPGSRFQYNTAATYLLHAIIEKASGKRMDRYLESALFAPLGIRRYRWELDKAGNPRLLHIAPTELLKFGELMLAEGKWRGKQLVSKAWIENSTHASQRFDPMNGLLWWLIPRTTEYVVDDTLIQEMREAGVSEAFLAKHAQLAGRYNVNIPVERLREVYGTEWNDVLARELYQFYPRRARWIRSAETKGFKAEGWLGQYLVVYPEKQLIGVRMVKESPSYKASTDEFMDFQNLLWDIIK